MIFSLAWKNIWRNPLRSGVVMGAVATGIWALMFLMSFFQGMVDSYINGAIENKTSHLQIHDPQFIDNQDMKFFLKDFKYFQHKLDSTNLISAAAPRIISGGLIASAQGNRGVLIKAIDPEKESLTTSFQTKIKEGDYLDISRKNPILLSKGLGKKLGVGLQKHVVLSFQDSNGEFVSTRCRVVGWYDTHNVKLDDAIVYVRYQDFAPLTGLPENAFHELAIKLKDIQTIDSSQTLFKKIFPGTLIRNYKEIAPDLALYTGQVKIALTIILVIIMIALVFGIINTMLMAVLERQKELGMLLAIGMNRGKVFFMVMLETCLLGLFAAPIGLLLGHVTIISLAKNGLNMTQWSDALAQFGMESIVYPSLEAYLYRDIVIALIITAIVGGIYPAYKAIKTTPAAALRKI